MRKKFILMMLAVGIFLSALKIQSIRYQKQIQNLEAEIASHQIELIITKGGLNNDKH